MVSRAQEVLAEVSAIGQSDLRWKEGRAFSLAYYAGPEVQAVADQAYAMYGSTNGLNADAFPSLKKFQADVVATVNRWVHGDETSAGFMTSGGTESILLAVKAARERGRREFGITQPNVVLPTSAHAAFEKACYYFGLESRRVPVRADWRADVEATRQAIDANTVLIVGSAPQYPQGVVDPIVDLAAIARERNINCHVDACMGGVTLTFLERLGENIPLWDFRVDGVTSISVDLHKYGYTSKGASVIMHRNRQLRSYQTFVTDNWLGGFYGSSGVLGTKSGGPMASAWAVMNYLGDEGYLRLTESARATTRQLADAIEKTDGLLLRAYPDSTLLSFGAQNFDVFAVADELAKTGWYVDRQAPPDSLHCTVNAVHHQVIEEFIVDLSHAVTKVRDAGSTGSVGAYGTIE
ncbi:MAG: aminotransferase class V-fold PLP-dependent enzyme [Ilumatobacteraceae bacterium]|jgi:sphinganine-1-phosphate aldolase|nr:aminotransferase class V-fold PLP-dependent enzyme [Ilumatobacteraceae bacterium]MDP5114339.1 aminotransferase class V-fold PLP-dependent enzyme [Ilumatobacteraceae bacterium]